MDPVKVRLEVDDEINALDRRAVASRNVRFGNLARVTSSGFVGRKRIEMSVHGGGDPWSQYYPSLYRPVIEPIVEVVELCFASLF